MSLLHRAPFALDEVADVDADELVDRLGIDDEVVVQIDVRPRA